MTITEEMVDTADDVFSAHPYGSYPRKDAIRAALEAVAPMWIEVALGDAYRKARAQGLREAAKIAVGAHDPRQMTLAERLLVIHERAQELEQK
jgi:hypothetical protein